MKNDKNEEPIVEATFESQNINAKRNTRSQKKKESIAVEPNIMELHSSAISDEEVSDEPSEDDVYILALVTMSEAEGESELGKRLVIDTILNRVDDDGFPNSIYDVVYQRNQFTSMFNGRAERVKDSITDEIYRLVSEEMLNRTNNDVLYFTAGKYGNYGTPAFLEGNHYFSTK